jgi:hypothetical protein
MNKHSGQLNSVEKFIINSHPVVRVLIVACALSALGLIIGAADIAESLLRAAWGLL